MVALSRHAQPAWEPPESLPWGPDFSQIKVSCDCRDYTFGVKSIRFTTAGVKWKSTVYPEHHHFPSVFSSVHFPPCSASRGIPLVSFPPPKTKRPWDVTLPAGCGQGVQQGREMQGLHWIWHKTPLWKPSASGFAFWSALSEAWQRELSRRSSAEAEEDQPRPGLLLAWGRAVLPMVGATGGHEAVRYGPASNTTLHCLYCILLRW